MSVSTELSRISEAKAVLVGKMTAAGYAVSENDKLQDIIAVLDLGGGATEPGVYPGGTVANEMDRISAAKAVLVSKMSAAGYDVSVDMLLDDLVDLLNLSSFRASIAVMSVIGTALTCTAPDGTVQTKTSTGNDTFTVTKEGYYIVSMSDGTRERIQYVAVADSGDEYQVTLTFTTTIYGASWDGSSSTRWTRTDASANFSNPVPYVAGASNYGSPFDNLLPWSAMQRVTDPDVGEMVAIPKFWYKLTQNGIGLKIQIADGPEDGFSTCPACMDRGDGVGERDYVLIGRYHCGADYKSSTGVIPKASTPLATFRTGIQALHADAYVMDWATRFTIWLLYLVEFADWNSQAKIGYGTSPEREKFNMGYTDDMPYHTGTTAATRSEYSGTQYRFIEGLWDNVCDLLDGCRNSTGGLRININPKKYESLGWVSVGVPAKATEDGWVSRFSVVNVANTFPLFISSALSGSSGTYACDSWLYDDTWTNIYSGGYYGHNPAFGMFYFAGFEKDLYSFSVGARPMKLPAAA